MIPSSNLWEVAERRVATARVLRRGLTVTECILWDALRGRRLDGPKFRRQHVFGPYVLDFCCPDTKLVVELDGAGHLEPEQRAYDEERSEYLLLYGYRVLRFANDEVFTNLPLVLEKIRLAAATQ